MDWLSWALLFIGTCSWAGLVDWRGDQDCVRWPPSYCAFVLLVAAACLGLVMAEIVVRLVSLGGLGVRDLD